MAEKEIGRQTEHIRRARSASPGRACVHEAPVALVQQDHVREDFHRRPDVPGTQGIRCSSNVCVAILPTVWISARGRAESGKSAEGERVFSGKFTALESVLLVLRAMLNALHRV